MKLRNLLKIELQIHFGKLIEMYFSIYFITLLFIILLVLLYLITMLNFLFI